MIKGAIFDMDGTLLDSMHMWNDLSKYYLTYKGYEVKENLPKYTDGLNYYETLCGNIRKYIPTMSDEEIIKEAHKYIGHFYKYEVKPKEGAVEFLEKLYNMGVKMCLATATNYFILEPALKRLDMLKYFSKVFTTKEIGVGKEKPLIFDISLEHLGTNKEDTYIFEDALYAIKTAKNNGYKVCAIYDKNEKEQDEIKALSDIYVTDYEDFFKNCKD